MINPYFELHLKEEAKKIYNNFSEFDKLKFITFFWREYRKNLHYKIFFYLKNKEEIHKNIKKFYFNK